MSWSEIKYALNSTVGTDDFTSLDYLIMGLYGQSAEYETPGTYSFEIPYWAMYAKITACGGGGGSGGSDSYSGGTLAGGGGGGGAAVYNQLYDIRNLAGTTISITVGAGGASAGPYTDTNGTAGGSTTIQGIVTLAGGRGGLSNENGATGGAAGGSGGGAGGTSARAGEDGILGVGGAAIGSGTSYSSGGGGGSLGDGNSGTKGAGGCYDVNGGDGYVQIRIYPGLPE